jgi:hypothetical protein
VHGILSLKNLPSLIRMTEENSHSVLQDFSANMSKFVDALKEHCLTF